jgi:hypothetical protein
MLADDGKAWPKDEPIQVAQLPEPVQAVARRENWRFARVVGQLAYGSVHEEKPGGANMDHVHVVDVATGRCLWRRAYAQFALPLPP